MSSREKRSFNEEEEEEKEEERNIRPKLTDYRELPSEEITEPKPKGPLPAPYSLTLESEIPPTSVTVYRLAEMCAPSSSVFSSDSTDIHAGKGKTAEARLVLNEFSEYCGNKIYQPPDGKIRQLVRRGLPIVTHHVTREAMTNLRDKFFFFMDEWLSASETEDYRNEDKRRAIIDTLWTELQRSLPTDKESAINAGSFQLTADLFNYLPYCEKKYCVAWAQDWASGCIDAYETPLSEWNPGKKISCLGGVFERLLTCLSNAFGVTIQDVDRQKRLLNHFMNLFFKTKIYNDYLEIEDPNEESKDQLLQNYIDFLHDMIRKNGEDPSQWAESIEENLNDETNGFKIYFGGRHKKTKRRRRKHATRKRATRKHRTRKHRTKRRYLLN